MELEIISGENNIELTPLEIIRTETALSRYPIHNLSTNDDVRIEVRRKDENGVTVLNWEVSHNSRYGQPGRLAYKLDTIIINRHIEEAGKPVPKTLRLGSLREIGAHLNAGEKNTHSVKRALLQNASAFINAKITYRAVDKSERSLEAAFSRYSVVFTGDVLPDGRKADAVYLVLNDIYAEVLNSAMTRPLDYDYLRELSPKEQRFYEIISYQIFPAVKYNQRARLVYSDYCALSTQVRYFDFDHVKKQMYKVHRPHIRSGYITRVEYEATVDGEGQPDWIVWYTPGPKARSDQLAFSFAATQPRRKREPARLMPEPRRKETKPPPEEETPQLPFAEAEPQRDASADALVRHFYETFHKNGQAARPSPRELAQARDLLSRLGEEQARHIVEFAHREAQKTDFAIQTFGGILQYEVQAGAEFEEAQRKTIRARRAKARQSHEERHRSRYNAFIGHLLREELEKTLPDVYKAFVAHEEQIRRFWRDRAKKSEQSAAVYARFDEDEQRIDRFLTFLREYPDAGIPDFWEWDARFNPDPYRDG